MKTPHKHAELIKAWADGAAIEYFDIYESRWFTAVKPSWETEFKYRIKPEPKPDVVEQCTLHRNLGWRYGQPPEGWNHAKHFVEVGDFKLTFDGETGKLKSAEVL